MQPFVIAPIRVIAGYFVIMLLKTTGSTDTTLIVGMIHTNHCATCFAGTGVIITIHVITGGIVYIMVMIHVTTDRTGITLHGVPFPDPLAAGGTGTIVIGFAQVHH